MKAQDKAKPVEVKVKWHPEVLRLAKLLGEFYDGSDIDHISSEAILDAAKDKKFQEWLGRDITEKPKEIGAGKKREAA